MIPLSSVIHILALHVILYLHRAGKLTWHGGLIPENEVWVKLTRDKGGGTLKMSLQLCNVENVNSVYNTIVFAIFKAGDNSFNFHVAL